MLIDHNVREAMQVVDIDGDGFVVEEGREIQLHQQYSINNNLNNRGKDLRVDCHE
jgi:ABC-type lipopolysaccharide export system ATPase subunit